jgi:hypothetical protein
VRLVLLDVEPLMTVRATTYDPAEAKAWTGCWATLVAPSPKFHCQIDGVPIEVSVNCTDWPAAGDAGLQVKEAARAARTVTVRLVLLEPEALVAVRVTVFEPAVV